MKTYFITLHSRISLKNMNKGEDKPVVGKPSEIKKVKEKKTKKVQNEATQNGHPNVNVGKLTEKQLRKLEWEKKLAEQKLKSESGDDKENLSKAEMKAKRREQQEAQRLAKLEKDKIKPTEVKPQVPQTPKSEKIKLPQETKEKSPLKKAETKKTKSNCLQLLQHLCKEPNPLFTSKNVNFREIHPAFVKLGAQYSQRVIFGSNARCLALLSAIKALTNDLQTPPKQEFCRYMEGVLQSCTDFLQESRPFAVSMTNALRHFKLQLTHMDKRLTDNEKRDRLIDVIELYIQNDIEKAWQSICMKVNAKIVNGDVILIYGSSSLIQKILLKANISGKKFSVIIVDGRPLLEGREMLRRLETAKIKCTYVQTNAISFAMKRATSVILGAHAVLTNGSVMSRIGTAQVALAARSRNIPVLVCCETYKFSERVQTDSFVYNEIGDSNLLVSVDTLRTPSPLVPLKENSKLNILNLLYDVTPPDLLAGVITEFAVLPCTSVPVVLRINGNDNI